MRIVFFGTPELAVPSLEALSDAHEVVALVCRPDKPKGRSKKLVPPPTKAWAAEHGIETHQPLKLNDGAFEAWLRERNPDVCALVAYGRILKQPILDVPKHGYINMHPSRLPQYRGPSPIQSAIRAGETETAISIMRLDAGMDTGDILIQEPVAIHPDDTAATLSDRLAGLGATLMVKGANLIESAQATFRPQGDSGVTVTRIFEKSDGRVRWGASNGDIVNLVRAANPWPMAQTRYQGDVYRIHHAQALDESHTEAPGTVLRVEKDAIIVAAAAGTVSLDRIQAPGKRAMSVSDFLRVRDIRPGDRFEDFS